MIVQSIQDSPVQIHGVIFIDCNEQPRFQNPKAVALTQLSQCVSQAFSCAHNADLNPSSRFVAINATMGLGLDRNDPSVLNTLRTFIWQKDHRTHLESVNLLLNTMSNFEHDRRTFAEFLPLLQEFDSYYITQWEDFVFWLSQRCNVVPRNWLVIGQQWQHCVHNNSMGLRSFARLMQYHRLDFYAWPHSFVTDQGTLTQHQDFVDDAMHWQQAGEFYRLLPAS